MSEYISQTPPIIDLSLSLEQIVEGLPVVPGKLEIAREMFRNNRFAIPVETAPDQLTYLFRTQDAANRKIINIHGQNDDKYHVSGNAIDVTVKALYSAEKRNIGYVAIFDYALDAASSTDNVKLYATIIKQRLKQDGIFTIQLHDSPLHAELISIVQSIFGQPISKHPYQFPTLNETGIVYAFRKPPSLETSTNPYDTTRRPVAVGI